MTESSLLSTWAVCGIAAAAARFLPVPLLDDGLPEDGLHGRVQPRGGLVQQE